MVFSGAFNTPSSTTAREPYAKVAALRLIVVVLLSSCGARPLSWAPTAALLHEFRQSHQRRSMVSTRLSRRPR